MKGPGLKIGLDVRRVWQCPACGATARTGGDVTARRCGCTDEGVWMRYVEPPRPARRPLLAVVTPDEPSPADVSDLPAGPPELPLPITAAKSATEEASTDETEALPLPEPTPPSQPVPANADSTAQTAPPKSGRRRRPRRSGGQADKRPA